MIPSFGKEPNCNSFFPRRDWLQSVELRRRFTQDNERRLELGLETVVVDERLLSAMVFGLPDCAGVALGFDRLLMAACGAVGLDEVIAFPLSHA